MPAPAIISLSLWGALVVAVAIVWVSSLLPPARANQPLGALRLVVGFVVLYGIVLLASNPLIGICGAGAAVAGLRTAGTSRGLSLVSLVLWGGLMWLIWAGPFRPVLDKLGESPL